MAVPPAPDDRSGVTQETSTDQDLGSAQRPTSHSLRLTLLVVLLALLLASTAAVAYFAATRPVPALGIEGSQAELQNERESAMAQAEQFMLRGLIDQARARGAASLIGEYQSTAKNTVVAGLYPKLGFTVTDAAFFTRDQLTLLREYVADRGGSLFMLAGTDSLDAGKYEGTPLADEVGLA